MEAYGVFDSSKIKPIKARMEKPIRQRLPAKRKLHDVGQRGKVVSQKAIPKTAFRPSGKFKTLAEIELANTIDIPEELVEEIQKILETETKALSEILLKEGVAPLLAYRHALDYIGVTLRDGLGVEPGAVDSDVEDLMANALKLRTVQYLLGKLKIPAKYKERYLNLLSRKLVDEAFVSDPKQILRSNAPDGTVGVITKKS